jgi:erythritol/L-threitol dehydrogenase
MTQSPAEQTGRIPERMKAVVCHGPKNHQLEEVVPLPGPGEALVKVEAVGICASDLKCYHGAAKFWGDKNRPAWAETKVIPGHEFTGTVVQLDSEAAERWGVAVGDRVVAKQIVPHLVVAGDKSVKVSLIP